MGCGKNNPRLKQLLDEFITPRAEETPFGAIPCCDAVCKNTKWVKDTTAPEEMKKFTALSGFFKQYADQYDD
jgi:hypothetical protein